MDSTTWQILIGVAAVMFVFGLLVFYRLGANYLDDREDDDWRYERGDHK